MIIEGAFYKLPELLIGSDTPDQLYESTLVSQFAMAVLLEFGARSIQQPMNRITIERPYPTFPDVKSLGRADIFVDLEGLIPSLQYDKYARYGLKSSNWLEVKLFARIDSTSGTQAKVSNTGSIAIDLLRLCLNVPENTIGRSRDNNRYFLSVFDRHPSRYLAFARQSTESPTRKWLNSLLTPGDQRLTIAYHKEPISFRSGCKSHGMQKAVPLTANLRVVTGQFGPVDRGVGQAFYGYLSRIVSFEIISGESRLYLEDTIQKTWDQEDHALQRSLAEQFLMNEAWT